MGRVYDGYRHGKHRNEESKGAKVHRCYTIGLKRGPIYRVLNSCSFMFSSFRYVSTLDDNFDVVFINQLLPVMMANLVQLNTKKYGKKIILHCLDLWLESLTLDEIRCESMIYKYYKRVSQKICKVFRLICWKIQSST